MCTILDMKDIILFRVARQIRDMRIQRGLSQSDLAAAAGVNRKTIIELEKGAAGIAFGTAVAVLEIMGGELTVVHVSKPTTAEMQSLLGLEGAFKEHSQHSGNRRALTSDRAVHGLSQARADKPTGGK